MFSGLIYKSFKLETTQIYISRRMDKYTKANSLEPQNLMLVKISNTYDSMYINFSFKRGSSRRVGRTEKASRMFMGGEAGL